MRIALITALWKRPELTRLFLRHYAEMEVPGVELVRLAAFSPGDDPYAAEVLTSEHRSGWTLVATPNEPLSDKWTNTLAVAQVYKADAILIMGSDDFVDAAYIQRIAAELENHPIIIPQSLYFYSTQKRELIYCTCSRGGPGRAIRRDVLDECGWSPWELGVDVGLEGAMDRRLGISNGRPFRKIIGEDLTILDVKSGDNMWPYEHVQNMLGRKEADPEAFLRGRLPGVADELLAMRFRDRMSDVERAHVDAGGTLLGVGAAHISTGSIET